jgi:hypothetical protein
MHPSKAKVVALMEQTTSLVDHALHETVRIVASPRQHGVTFVGTALLTFPLLAFSAIITDLGYVMVARSKDADWDRVPPLDAPDS